MDMPKTEIRIGKLVDRIDSLSHERAIAAIENKIGKLEKHKLVLAEKAANLDHPAPAIEESIQLSLQLLANPYNI